MNRLLISLLVLFAGLLATPSLRAQALESNQIDSIVAVVEEDVILRSELDRALNSILAQYADRRDQLPPQDILQRQVLERLVLLRLQLQRAESAGVRVSDSELEQAIYRVAQQNRISIDEMRRQLARDGLDFNEFRSSLREEMIAQRLRQNIIQSRVTVTDTEIDIALASNSLKRGQIQVALILIGVPDGATQEQIDTALKKAEGVRDLVNRGEMTFGAAAIRYSDAPNALEGGDLGWRSFDEIPAMFANVLQGMQKGEVSPPLRGPSGYQLLQLVDSREDSQETITEYNARDIMIRKTELVDSADAHSKIEALRARIVAGEDFAEIAREHSEDSMTRNAGGDMGWFQINAWGNAVADNLQRLKDGELSPAFETDAGWHLVQRIATRVQDVTEASLRNRARETIAKRKSEEEFERFLRQLRDESYVETRLKG